MYYYNKLSKNEEIEIDRQVSKNREKVYIFVRNVLSNTKSKTKKVIILSALGVTLLFSNVKSSNAIGLSMPPQSIVRIERSYKNTFELRTPIMVARNNNLIAYISNRKILFFVSLTDPQICSNKQVLKIMKELRGGSFILTAIKLAVLILILRETMSFISQHYVDPGWGLERQNPFQPQAGEHKFTPYYEHFSDTRKPSSVLENNRPAAMPHDEFAGLTKEARRNLPNINVMIINHEGHQKLYISFGQAKFKVGDHGAIHDLPYTINANGETRTPKTDENTLKMMRSIVDMPNRKNVRWFDDGTYQGGTARGFEAIHIYDSDNQIIAVFKKSTGQFVTTCKLSKAEEIELVKTKNFGGEKNQQGMNNSESDMKNDMTLLNTFENDVMRITPRSPSPNPGYTPSPNLDYTPINSFESNVMGITLRNNSQINNL